MFLRACTHSRDFVDGDYDGGQELVGDGPHVFDGRLETRAHLLVAHGLLWRHVVRQLAVQETGPTVKRRLWAAVMSTSE